MATKYAGRLAVLKRGDGAEPEVFATVAQVSAMGSFGSERALIEAPAYGEEWIDYVTGLKEGAEMELELHFDPEETTHTALEGDYNSATGRRNFRIEFSGIGATGWQFDIPGVVRSFNTEAALDGTLKGTVAIKIVDPGVTSAAMS